MYHRFPIKKGLLDIILYETEREFPTQPYLEIMYKTVYSLAYYGMMRIGELVWGVHTLKAKDVYDSTNKVRGKLMLVLHSSKTHGKESRPQQIKIESNPELTRSLNTPHCPFEITKKYMIFRGDYIEDTDDFIVYSDGSQVLPEQVRAVLRKILSRLSLNPSLYDTHSFRIGRATDMQKAGISIEEIKRIGRWRSNAVYQYFRHF